MNAELNLTINVLTKISTSYIIEPPQSKQPGSREQGGEKSREQGAEEVIKGAGSRRKSLGSG